MAVNNVKNQTPSIVPGAANGAGSAGEAKKTEKVAPKQAADAYKATANTPRVSDAANVQISQKAREMNQARKIVDETPDIREDKVAKFKELIAKGQYKPDAGKIADGILNEAIKDELAKSQDANE